MITKDLNELIDPGICVRLTEPLVIKSVKVDFKNRIFEAQAEYSVKSAVIEFKISKQCA